MNTTKTITLILLFIILQLTVNAQTVNYVYDESGNRVQRWMEPPQQIAPPQNNANDSILTIATEISSIIAADSMFSKGEEEKGTTGLTFLTEGDIKVFPNPVQEKLNVQFNGTAKPEGCSLQIYDGAGRLFYNAGSMQLLTEVNMQAAKKGVYFLVVQTKDGKRLYWKLIKE